MKFLALDIAFNNTGYVLFDKDLTISRIGCLTISSHPRIIHTFKIPTFKTHQQDSYNVSKTQYVAIQLVEVLQAYSFVVQELLDQTCPDIAIAEITFLGGMSSKAITLMTSAVTTWTINLWFKSIKLVSYIPQQVNKFVKEVTECSKVTKEARKKCVEYFIPDMLSLDSKGRQEHVIDAMLVGIYHLVKIKELDLWTKTQ